jgi:hypothetical protein
VTERVLSFMEHPFRLACVILCILNGCWAFVQMLAFLPILETALIIMLTLKGYRLVPI